MPRGAALGGVFALVTAVMLYFLALSPLMADNFVFSHDITPGFAQFYRGAPIEARPPSIGGAFRQACEMYTAWCGRFTGNLTVYLLFMLPHWLYCFLAACAFSLYLWLLQMCVFGRSWRKRLTPGWILALAAMLWLGIPSFGEAFLWLSVGGQLALLGQAAILLPYRFALDGPPARAGLAPAIGLFLAGMFVASLDYPTSAALPPTALAGCWLLWRRRRKIPWTCLWGAFGLCAGAFFTLAAPGNAERLRLTHDQAVHQFASLGFMQKLVQWLLHLPGAMLLQWLPLLLLGIGVWCLWRQYGRKTLARIPQAAWLFILPALLTHGAYLFTAWPPPRAFATSFAQLLVGACIIFASAREAGCRLLQGFGKVALLLAIGCAGSVLWEGWKFWELHGLIAQREAILQKGGEARLAPLPPGSGDRYWVLGKYLQDISGNPHFWVNRAMAAHYGLNTVMLAPAGETLWRLPGYGDLRLSVKNDVVRATGGLGKLHLYYYGEPALLCRLPVKFGRKVFAWLAAGHAPWLVPILLARADLSPEGGTAPLKLFSDRMFWLARPGAGPASLDILPLAREAAENRPRGKRQ